jgi:uncharacterized membrane protein
MATPPTSDAPFGLQPNVAAGLAYLLGIIGGIIMLVGGGTNRAVKWAAAQSITMWGIYFVAFFAINLVGGLTHIYALFFLTPIIGLIWFVLWLWTSITAFQGKEVKIPVIAGVTESIFKSAAT